MHTNPLAESETTGARATQGDLATLDENTQRESLALQRQMRAAEEIRNANAPIIWGSIRALAVYGKWSFWRNPTPRKP
jgi:hypothetical protein